MRNSPVSRLLPPVLVLGLVVLAWAWYVHAAAVPSYLLPAPTDVARRIAAHRRALGGSLLTTAEAALIGFVGAAVLGVLAGVALASSVLVRRAFYPYTVFFQTVPIVAVAPLLVIWLGYGLASVATSALLVSVFPVIANTLVGLRSTDPALEDLFRLYGAGRVATLWKLRLPWALPSIFTGLRVAGGLAVIGAVVGEFLVGTLGENEGLGVKIVSAMKRGQTDEVFAAVLIASLLGLAIFGAINLASYAALRRWHASEGKR